MNYQKSRGKVSGIKEDSRVPVGRGSAVQHVLSMLVALVQS